MFDLHTARNLLKGYGIPDALADEITNDLLKHQVRLGEVMYCVTRYDKHSSYEVIAAKVTRTHITEGKYRTPSRKVLCVVGKYAPHGEYNSVYAYKANFYSTSIGSTIFFTQEEAQQVCDRLNKKQ